MKTSVSAAIIVIGNEVLSGRTKDANIAYLAEQLTELGISVSEARIIADDEQTIVDVVNELRAKNTYVFTTGGIGPTHDDITAASVAKAFGVPVVRTDEARAMLESHYAPEDLNAARLKMADTPQGALLIENPISKAPGFQIENVFVLAGVPKICQALFDNLKGRLQGGEKVLSQTISCSLPEGVIANALETIQKQHTIVEIGSYPYMRNGEVGVSLVARSTNPERLTMASGQIKEMILELKGRIISS